MLFDLGEKQAWWNSHRLLSETSLDRRLCQIEGKKLSPWIKVTRYMRKPALYAEGRCGD